MKLAKKLTVAGASAGALVLSVASLASAHVTVKPGEALTSQYTTFNVSVPVEKDQPTTSIKVEIPDGLIHVTPTVKPGWNIDAEKEGSGEEAVVKSITWSGNEIGAGYRDDFTFSAKTPENDVELKWNAYQTYADGTVVAWDLTEEQQPKKADGSPDFSKSGPFSVTKVAAQDPQAEAVDNVQQNINDVQKTANMAFYAGIAGVVLGLIATFLATRKKK